MVICVYVYRVKMSINVLERCKNNHVACTGKPMPTEKPGVFSFSPGSSALSQEPETRKKPRFSPLLDITKLPYRNIFTFLVPFQDTADMKKKAILDNKSEYPAHFRVLRAIEENNQLALLNKFLNCGKIYNYRASGNGHDGVMEHKAYSCTDCGHSGKVREMCGMKICPDCIQKRILTLFARYRPHVENFKSPKLLTLTVRNFPTINNDRVRFILKAFSKLRRRKVFRCVRGGVYFVETTNTGNGWHIHIHAVIDSPYLPRNDRVVGKRRIKGIKSIWESYTDSFIVDIRKVKSGKSGLAESIKRAFGYVSGSKKKKPNGEHLLPKITKDSDLLIYELALDQVRLAGTFGSMYNIDSKERPVCERCGSENIEYNLVREMIVRDFVVNKLTLPPPWSFLIHGDVIEKRAQLVMAVEKVDKISYWNDRHTFRTCGFTRIVPDDCHVDFLYATLGMSSQEILGLLESGMVDFDQDGFVYFLGDV